MSERRRPHIGLALILLGAIGLVGGVVPLVTNALRMLVDPNLWNAFDLATHGVEAMGLSIEWALLSSAMGAFLGVLLIRAGLGWRRGSEGARSATWQYVACALVVNATDLSIFVFQARHGPMRGMMIAFDAAALAVPVVLAVWLIRSRNPSG